MARCAILAAGIVAVSCSGEWQAPIRKKILDTNKNGYIEEDECICGVESDLFTPPTITRKNIDYSVLRKYEAVARSMAASATALSGDLTPEEEIRLLSDMLYQDTRGILGCWLGYTPDSYGTAFNKSYNMTKSVKLVSTMDCAYAGACDYTKEHISENITERFIEQLGRNATLHHPYVYAKGCCNPVSYGDYLGTSEWAWMWNYFSPDPLFDFWTLPLRDYLYGNTTWLDAGKWSDPYVDPVAGVMVSFGVPYVTKIPIPGSVDPFIFNETGHAHPGFMKSFEGLYVMGVAGLDVRLNDIILSCQAGFYSTYPTCSLCPLGRYRTVTDPGDTCLGCERGSYTDQNGSSACMICSRGYSQAVEGRTACDRCSPGTAQNERGMSTCTLCTMGSATADWNASDCARCPIGQYADSRGASSCLQCPNQMATGGLGSISATECKCAERTFLGATSGLCETCPSGMTCPVGSVDPTFRDMANTPLLLPGYYSSVDKPLSVYSCADETSCPGGLPGTCGGGHIALACQLCVAGEYAASEGDCRQCDSAGVGPFVALFVTGLTGAAISHSAVNFPLLKTKRTSMAGVFLAGLVVTTMLSFNIYASLNTVWVSPMSDLFSILRVLAFDLKILKFSCIAGSSKLMPRYAFKLAAIPGAFLVVCIVSFLMKFTKWTRDYAFFSIPDLINSGGLLFSVFFIAVSLASLEGFMCVHNPNGKDSLISDRSVVCWDSPEHTSLLVASILAILLYPVNFLVVTGLCTWRYYALAERFGTKFTFCMRFLMNRWNPDQYYFGTIFTIRNFALTIAPITQPNNYDIQVTLLQLIFLTWLLTQLSLRPWRFDILNKFDAITSAMQIVVLNCFGLLGGKVTADTLSAQGAGYIAFGTFVFVMVLTFAAAAISLAQKFRKLKEYGLFLSHHKGADALYARQIKLMLAMVTTRQVFLDVDNLASLDELVFLVRSCVDNLVVMLSPETLNRFWCAVEIICATKNRMPIILTNTQPVEDLLGAQYIYKASSMWGPGEILDFNKVGIDGSVDTEMAYRYISTLPIIRMLMNSSERDQMEAVAKIISVAKGCRTEKRGYKIESHQVSYVVYNTTCYVQACCARILCMLMKINRWNCAVLSDEINRTEVINSVMLVLVSQGLSRDPIGLGHVCYSNQNGVPFTTIVSQEDYQKSKPSKDYLEQLQYGSAFDVEQMAVLARIAPGVSSNSMADVVVALYASLAARLNPQDSEHMLLVEVSTIVKRAEQHLAKFTQTMSGNGDMKKLSSMKSMASNSSNDAKLKVSNAKQSIPVLKPSVNDLNLPPLVEEALGERIIEVDGHGMMLAFRDL